MQTNKYSDIFMDWLKEFGYTHCFFVGGGNVMHLLESASSRFECIPVVHEVAAGIAAEYFNEISENKRAFAMVTAGPGLTNIVTAIGGAWLENRELLVVGGQAKTSDLSEGKVRQIGHQEIDGIGITSAITKAAVQLKKPMSKSDVWDLCELSRTGKKGPVFLEICLDVTASQVVKEDKFIKADLTSTLASDSEINKITELLKKSERPLLLIGGGVDRERFKKILPLLVEKRIPLATTFNGADRIGSDYKYYCGRPNWYGMRWSNIILQQSDLLICLGTRLGIQQVGFAWEHFAPNAHVIQVDLDVNEINKGFPKIDTGLVVEVNDLLERLVTTDLSTSDSIEDWLNHIEVMRETLEVVDSANIAQEGFVELQSFLFRIGEYFSKDDIVIPCSSGGSYTGAMQMFKNKTGQLMVTDKSLASMGYGLSGAIGAAIAFPNKRTILIEGDGGFAQNMQEIGTVKNRNLNLKMFIASNKGYASIRTTQKAYFNNNYVGCDEETGLGLPNWQKIFGAYGINTMQVNSSNQFSLEFQEALSTNGPFAFIIELDPDQLYFPKLTSRVMPDGRMESNPLHLMTPPLATDISSKILKWL
jgi:acetolactate synthase-1/2/3 large subunit